MTEAGSAGLETAVYWTYDATVILDTGGAITQPPLVTWSELMHYRIRTVEH